MEDKEEKMGFYVKASDTEYKGPFASLKEARNTARSFGPNKEIYHGILRLAVDGFDNRDLHLVPKVKK